MSALLIKLKLWNYRHRLMPEQRKIFDKKLVIAQLRAEYAFWGHDTSNMTDEEIEAGVMRMAEVLRSTGVSCEQAAENFRMMGKILRGTE